MKTCAELGHKSSCNTADGYTAVNANVTGSDGTCYDCNVASCPSGYSTSTTSCSGGYALDTDGKSDGKACGKCVKTGCTADSDCGNSQYCLNYTCTTVPCDTSNGYTVSNHVCVATDCPLGYSASTTSCSGGYTLNTSGKSGGKACGKCVAANCPDGYSTSVTSCNSCSTFSQNGYSAGNPCGKCTPKTCSSVSCDESKGYTASTDSCGCTTCAEKACPSGYSTSTTSCGSDYTLKTNGYSGGKACGKCEEAGCSAYGYYSSCPAGKVLAGSNIGNCYARCDDVKCSSGYQKTQPSCSGEGYELLTETVSGVTCYKCGNKPCPSGYATFIQGHKVDEAFCQGSNYETNGYSGSYACGKCVSRPSSGSSSSTRVCTRHSDCSRGYECTDGGLKCKICRAGSNIGSGLGDCNCPENTWSTGNGGCSNDCPSGYKKEYQHGRDVCVLK